MTCRLTTLVAIIMTAGAVLTLSTGSSRAATPDVGPSLAPAGLYVYKVGPPDTPPPMSATTVNPERSTRTPSPHAWLSSFLDSWRTGISSRAVLAANGIKDPSRLRFGQDLHVPPPSAGAVAGDQHWHPRVRLEARLGGGEKVRISCDPCWVSRDFEKAHVPQPIVLRVEDARGRVGRLPLHVTERDDDSRWVQEVFAWSLPDGDLLVAVKLADDPGGMANWLSGVNQLVRVGPGPSVTLLATAPGDRGNTCMSYASTAFTRFDARMEEGRFVLSEEIVEHESTSDPAFSPDPAYPNTTSDSRTELRYVYDPAKRSLWEPGTRVVFNRGKKWRADETEPEAWTDEAPEPLSFRP